METLKELVSKHRFVRNGMRINLDNDPDNVVRDKSQRKWLRQGPYSNTLRDPNHPIVQHVHLRLANTSCSLGFALMLLGHLRLLRSPLERK